MTPNVRISKLEYEEIRKLFLKHFGIVLSDDISPVADSKLYGLFEKYNIKSLTLQNDLGVLIQVTVFCLKCWIF